MELLFAEHRASAVGSLISAIPAGVHDEKGGVAIFEVEVMVSGRGRVVICIRVVGREGTGGVRERRGRVVAVCTKIIGKLRHGQKEDQVNKI